jgi:hypothetical protein
MSFSTSGTSGSLSLALTSDNINLTLDTVSQPAIVNFPLENANEEYELTLPANTKRFIMKPRDCNLKMAFVQGTSGSTYFTLPKGSYWSENAIADGVTVKIYLQTARAHSLVEVILWS